MKPDDIIKFVDEAVSSLRRAVVRGPLGDTEVEQARFKQQSEMLLRWEFIALCLDRCKTDLPTHEYYAALLSDRNKTILQLEIRCRELERLLKSIKGD